MSCFCLLIKIYSFSISKQLPNCFDSFELYNEIHAVVELCISIEIDLFD